MQVAICEQYDEISKQLKELETAKNAISNQLKNYMKENEVGMIGNRKVTWKTIYKTSLDQKRLKTEKPEIFKSAMNGLKKSKSKSA